jgi:phosphate transport system permease protein
MKKDTNQKIAFIIIKLIGVLVIGILLWIQGFIIINGIGVISWEFLTQTPYATQAKT